MNDNVQEVCGLTKQLINAVTDLEKAVLSNYELTAVQKAHKHAALAVLKSQLIEGAIKLENVFSGAKVLS